MNNFVLWAQPWWVNLLLLVPVNVVLIGLKSIPVSLKNLFWSAVFASAFGFIEAAVVIYLRAITGTAGQVSPNINLSGLFRIELLREIFTLIMIGSVAILSSEVMTGRWISFLWIFAFWDLVYYLVLNLFIGWPASLTDSDVLFLVPVPWTSQVWFPLFISASTIAVISIFTLLKK